MGLARYDRRVRKLLVFQHSASEPLGVLDPLLRRRGFRIRYVNFGRDPLAQPDVGRYDGVVVLGGPMHVDQASAHPHLRVEIRALEAALARGLPVLGIFRFGAAAYGLQFHLEADEAMIRRWLAVPAYRSEIEREGGPIKVARTLRETGRHAAPGVALGERVFDEFVRIFAHGELAAACA